MDLDYCTQVILTAQTYLLLTRLMANIETVAVAIIAHWIVLQRRQNKPFTHALLQNTKQPLCCKSITPQLDLLDISSKQTHNQLQSNSLKH